MKLFTKYILPFGIWVFLAIWIWLINLHINAQNMNENKINTEEQNADFTNEYQNYKKELLEQKNIDLENTQTIVLAGGCFWCIEWAFDEFPWVASAVSGYIGWDASTATYDQVSSGTTDHREAVKVTYDPSITDLNTILDRFFSYIDPYDEGWQFADRWYHYTTAIYYSDEDELQKIDEYIENKDFEKPIATNVEEITDFYEAEEYHQDYARKSSFRYNIYFKWSWRKDYVENNK